MTAHHDTQGSLASFWHSASETPYSWRFPMVGASLFVEACSDHNVTVVWNLKTGWPTMLSAQILNLQIKVLSSSSSSSCRRRCRHHHLLSLFIINFFNHTTKITRYQYLPNKQTFKQTNKNTTEPRKSPLAFHWNPFDHPYTTGYGSLSSPIHTQQPSTESLLPWKLTCPLKIDGWKMYSLLKW